MLRSDSVLDQMVTLMRRFNNDQTRVKREMIGCIIMTRYNRRTYRVDDVDFSKNPKSN